MASAANTGFIFVLLQRVAHALGVGEGCAATASYPEMRSDHPHTSSFRTAPSLCPDTIFGNDSGASQSCAAKLSGFRRNCVGNRNILLQTKFWVGAAAPLGYRLRGRTDPARAQRRLWRLMASDIKATSQKEDLPEKETLETAPDGPLLDLSDAAVKKLIRTAKKRGYVTHDQINSVLPSEEVNSEQIENVLAMFSEMGVNVVETEEPSEEGEEPREEADEEAESEGGELVEVQQKVPAKSEAKEPTERTDDPVRMYLREMGSVELLSREGEIAIAKRIEAGREAMIAGLCESPLTFQAIIIWRDELNEGKIFLRDIIDLEATYAGPDAKNNMNPGLLAAPLGADGQPLAAVNGNGAAAMPAPPAPAHIAPPAAPPAPTPFRAAPAMPAAAAEGERTSESSTDSDIDDDEV